jgi:hypothetical protein
MRLGKTALCVGPVTRRNLSYPSAVTSVLHFSCSALPRLSKLLSNKQAGPQALCYPRAVTFLSRKGIAFRHLRSCYLKARGRPY